MMALFIDVHHTAARGLDAETLAEVHSRDVAIQDSYGVRFLRYWFDPVTGKTFCLSEAPSMEAVNAVHQQANGTMADEIFVVYEGQ
jgi:hypothetical protein